MLGKSFKYDDLTYAPKCAAPNNFAKRFWAGAESKDRVIICIVIFMMLAVIAMLAVGITSIVINLSAADNSEPAQTNTEVIEEQQPAEEEVTTEAVAAADGSEEESGKVTPLSFLAILLLPFVCLLPMGVMSYVRQRMF